MVLDRAQRDALYQFVVTDLVGVGDVALTLRAGEVAEAQSLRMRFEEDFGLLDLLGWRAAEERDSWELTLSHESARALGRLRTTATTLIAEAMVACAEDVLDEAARVVRTCGAALAELRE
jgi:hypothetical protein